MPPLRNDRLREFIDAIPDAGVRANVETAICLKATAMLATGESPSTGVASRSIAISSSVQSENLVAELATYSTYQLYSNPVRRFAPRGCLGI